jgi:acyl carrier protein
VNASFSFDASVKQLVQLLSGRTLVLIPQEIRRDPPALVRYLQEHEVDAIDCTPSQLRAWMSAGLLTEGPHNLRLVLIGGEPIDADLWRALATLSTTHFYNVYGPTESTVDATFACLNGDYSAPHIGRPMLNRSIYILDKHSRPLPIGVAGELYIGGAGVARGYLKRARLTSECFVADPFHPDPAARMYKTGDIARWRADGTIDYLGRNDQQVKIRGFRVELGEIEVHLRRIDEVQQVAVITREDTPGHVLLVAYFVPRDRAAPPSAAELRMRLQAVLPDYMVPNAFVELQQIPLNQNGKLDRKALPAPGAVAFCERQYRAPVGEVEEAVASIWQTILGAQEIGRHESFFDLGGHSLSATQVVSRIQALFCVEIPVSTVFDLPRLSDLARRVEELRSSHLLRRVVQGVGEMEEELRSRVAALTDAEVQKLLDELPTEERR